METLNFKNLNDDVMEPAFSFIESFVSFADQVPLQLQRWLTRLKEIDVQISKHLCEVNALYTQVTGTKEVEASKINCNIKTIKKFSITLDYCRQLGDEKISIVQHIKDYVDLQSRDVEKKREDLVSYLNPQWKDEMKRKRELSKNDQQRSNKRSKRRPGNSDKSFEKNKLYEPSNNQLKGSSLLLNDDIIEDCANSSRTSYDQTSEVSADAAAILSIISNSHNKVKNEDFSITTEMSETVNEPADIWSNSSFTNPRILNSVISNNSSGRSSSTSSSLKSSGTKSNNAKLSTSSSNKESTSGSRKQKKRRKHKSNSSASSTSKQLEIPVDPNEPTYCFCKQVSFGSMILCDNKKCRFEWFHFTCVGLTQKPKNNKKWFCPDCLKERKNRENK